MPELQERADFDSAGGWHCGSPGRWLEGKLEGKRTALLRLMRRAGLDLTEVERARIEACADADALDRWLDNLLGAKTAAEVLC